MLTVHNKKINHEVEAFCKEFLEEKPDKRLVFGRNEYAKSIANMIEIGAFIDDFAIEKSYIGKPIIKTEDIPSGSLVVSSVMVHPLTVGKILTEANISHVDYFSFYEYSGIKLMPVTFWKIFKEDFKKNRKKYNWIYGLLNDLESKNIFEKIVNFRFSANLSYMKGFKDRQKEQYFEDFLDLKKSDEIFYDVGGYDGFTTLEFIKRCPDYRSVYIFEPESKNMKVIKKKLAERKNINFIQKGLSNKKETVKFSVEGSASKISEDGEIEISVDLLDHILDDAVTFMKMDIEGGEKLAIEGARQTILKNHPRLAVSVYHVGDDLWRIPEQIMSIRDDYKIYLRHYTEGVTETVMFFIP